LCDVVNDHNSMQESQEGMGRRFADPVATLSAYSINRRRGKP
jgi:hypothetical protein